MGLTSLFYPYGIFIQALALFHFFRRRPDGYWLWIIIFGGGLGALVYVVVEVIPDAGLLREGFKMFPRRHRIGELEYLVHDSPTVGRLEELGALYLEDGKYAKAKACFDQAIASRADSPDTFYRRGLAELGLGDYASAVGDLERVVKADPRYDFHRAAGLLAHAYAQTGQTENARALFERVTNLSTSTEIQYYYASFLMSQGQKAEAKDWIGQIKAKKRTMPGFQKRRDRPWFRRVWALERQVGK